MSRPARTAPAPAAANWRWKASRASRTSGIAATLEARLPHHLVAQPRRRRGRRRRARSPRPPRPARRRTRGRRRAGCGRPPDRAAPVSRKSRPKSCGQPPCQRGLAGGRRAVDRDDAGCRLLTAPGSRSWRRGGSSAPRNRESWSRSVAASSTATGCAREPCRARESHRDAVVELGVDHRAARRRPAAAVDDQVVPLDLDRDAAGGEPRGDGAPAGRSP